MQKARACGELVHPRTTGPNGGDGEPWFSKTGTAAAVSGTQREEHSSTPGASHPWLSVGMQWRMAPPVLNCQCSRKCTLHKGGMGGGGGAAFRVPCFITGIIAGLAAAPRNYYFSNM